MNDKTKDLEKKELNELSDEEIENVSGGYIQYVNDKYRIIDDKTGKILKIVSPVYKGFFDPGDSDAIATAKSLGQSTLRIDQKDVNDLLKQNSESEVARKLDLILKKLGVDPNENKKIKY